MKSLRPSAGDLETDLSPLFAGYSYRRLLIEEQIGRSELLTLTVIRQLVEWTFIERFLGLRKLVISFSWIPIRLHLFPPRDEY